MSDGLPTAGSPAKNTEKMRVKLSRDGVDFSFVCFDNPQTRSTCRRDLGGGANLP
jgi:hypothetical protein